MRSWIKASVVLLAIGAGLSAAPNWLPDEPIPTEPGSDFALEGGATFYLEIVENQFYAVFIDEERLPQAPPVDRIILRGDGHQSRASDFNLVLTSVAGAYLSHSRQFYPPYDFWITVVVPGAGEETEILPRTRFRQ